MKTYYYIGCMPLSRIDTLKGFYGDMITDYLNENLESKIYDNNVLMIHDIFDLASDPNNIEEIAEIYQNLLERNITIYFEKSKQCDSEYLKAQLKTLKKYSVDNMIKLLYLAIDNYKEVIKLERKQRTAVIEKARAKGTPIGNRKGSTRQTKKSIEAKKQIKELSKSFDGTMSDIDLIGKLGIARNTYFKYKKEIKEELKNNK